MGVVKVALASKMSVLVSLCLLLMLCQISSFTTMFEALSGKSKIKEVIANVELFMML